MQVRRDICELGASDDGHAVVVELKIDVAVREILVQNHAAKPGAGDLGGRAHVQFARPQMLDGWEAKGQMGGRRTVRIHRPYAELLRIAERGMVEQLQRFLERTRHVAFDIDNLGVRLQA